MLSFKRPWLILLLAILLAAALLALGLVLLAPSIESFSAGSGLESGSTGQIKVPAGAPLRVTFSQPMQPSSVEAHLTINPPVQGEYAWEETTLTFLPDQPWPAGATVTITLASGARANGGLRLPLLRGASLTFTVSNPQILYLYPTSGPADLYLLAPESGLPERLTTIQGGILSYSATGDGRQIYFAARNGQIYQLDRLTQEINLAVPCPAADCSDPQVSPDGGYLAYVRIPAGEEGPRSYPHVWLQPLPDGEAQLADPGAISTRLPGWSSQGWLAYYDEIAQQYRMVNPTNGSRQAFDNQTGEAGTWSADGFSFIAPEIFLIPNAYLGSTGSLEPMPTSHLLRYELESGQSQDLTGEDTLEDTSPASSPGGQKIAFARKYLDPARWTPGRQLWIMQADGTQGQALTDDPFHNHSSIRWKPDSSQLLFVRSNQTDLSEPLEIWQINADGSQPIRLVIGGFAPQWIP
ncbi:MAG: Ig-like domain-containing protein [Anaerolineales bacterium]|jgi:Tol biopolymer transport system component